MCVFLLFLAPALHLFQTDQSDVLRVMPQLWVYKMTESSYINNGCNVKILLEREEKNKKYQA